MNHATRHRLGILLRVLLVAGCLGYAFWNVDLGGLAGALAGIDPLRVVAALLLSGVSYLLLAVRLRVLTHGRAGIASGLAATLLCLGLNNLMPARLGEVGSDKAPMLLPPDAFHRPIGLQGIAREDPLISMSGRSPGYGCRSPHQASPGFPNQKLSRFPQCC